MGMFRRHNRKGQSDKPTVARCRVFRPGLEALEDRVVPASKLDALSEGLRVAMTQLDQELSRVASQYPDMPVLNQPLGTVGELVSTGIRIYKKIDSALNSPTLTDEVLTGPDAETAIRNALIGTLGYHKDGGLLGDWNGDGQQTAQDVFVDVVDLASPSQTIMVALRLTGSDRLAAQTFTFGTGLPGIPFQIDGNGQLVVEANYDYKNLRFGLNSGAFTLDTSAADELTAGVTAKLVSPEMTGIVGFLEVNVRPAGLNELSTTLAMDVVGPPTAPQVASSRLGGRADVNLALETRLASDKAPSVATEFVMSWDLNGTNPDPNPKLVGLGSEPTVDFKNVRVSMGSFVTGIIGPIVKNIQTALKPIQPVLTVLNYRIPGLSDLMEAGGQGPVSLLTLAKAASAIGVLPPNIGMLVRLADTVSELNTLVNGIVIAGTRGWLPVGDFNLNGPNLDLRGVKPNYDTGAFPTLESFLQSRAFIEGGAINSLVTGGGGVATLEHLVNAADEEYLDRDAKDRLRPLIERIKNGLGLTDNGFNLEFPVFQNPVEGVFKLLLGQDVDFVTFTGKYGFFDTFRQNYKLFDAFGVSAVGFLQADIDLKLNFKMGYDSYGLRQYWNQGTPDPFAELAKGLYIGTGPLIELSGGVGIGVEGKLSLFKVEDPFFGTKFELGAGVQVVSGFSIDRFQFGLDPAGGPKFRVDTKADQLFQTAGKVKAGVKFEVVLHTPIPGLTDIILYSKSLASHTLLNLDSDVYRENPFKTEGPQRVPVVTDLNRYPQANDGVPNRVFMEQVGDQYRLRADNGTDDTTFFDNYWPLDTVGSIKVLGGNDDDIFNTGAIGGDRGDPRDISLDGGGGRNTTVARAPSWSNEFTFAAGKITIRNAYTIQYESMDEIQAFARARGVHTSRVTELADGMKLTIHGSPQGNLFLLGDGRADRLNGDLKLIGGPGRDELRIDDQNNRSRASYFIADDKIVRTSIGLTLTPAPPGGVGMIKETVNTLELSPTGLDAVTIFGGGPSYEPWSLVRDEQVPVSLPGEVGHRFQVEATKLQVSFHGGTGGDMYVIGSEEFGLNGRYNNLNLRVSISDKGGWDSLTINDRGSAFYNFGTPPEVAYTVTDQTIVRTATQYYIGGGEDRYHFELAYAGIRAEEVSLHGTNSPATYSIQSTARGGSLATLGVSFFGVYTGTGDDTVTLGTFADELGGLKAFVDLQDRGGTDLLTFNARSVVVEPGLVSRGNRLLFGYDGFETVSARVPDGNYTVTVQGLDEGVALFVRGARAVDLGRGNLTNIKGSVNILTDNRAVVRAPGFRGYHGSPDTRLTFDDSLNPNPTAYDLTPTSFTSQSAGGPQLNVTFASAVVRFVTLRGGSTGNTITLDDTQSPTNTLLTWLYTGAGINGVYVERARSNVSVIGQGGLDFVYVGKNDSVQGITGNLSISNPGGTSLVYLHNAADTDRRAVRLDRAADRNTPFNPADDRLTVRGLTPSGTIGLRGPDVRTLSIFGGAGGGTYDVYDTFGVGSGSRTFLTTGSGADRINVRKTSTPLTVDPGAGENRVTVGGPSGGAGDLGLIAGDVTLRGEPGVGTNYVNVIDQAWPANLEYEMDAAGLRRTLTNILGIQTVTTVNYEDFPFADLNLFAGNGNNRFTVAGTPTATDGVRVFSGRGVDSLALLGTNGDLTVNLGGGLNQQVDVGDATHAMEALNGTITIQSAQPVEARVTNEATTEEQVISLDQFNTTGFSMYRAELRNNQYHFESELRFTRISSLDFRYGRGYQNVGVNGTPAGMTLHAHSYPGQQDYFTFGTSLDRALGPVHFYGQEADQDAAYAYDYLNPNPHTYTFRPDPADPADVIYERDGQAPFHMHMVKNILFYAARGGGNTVNIQRVPEGSAHTVVLGPGDQATVGSAAPGLGGTLADIRGALGFAGGPDVRLTFDDSGNTDLTPKRVTFDATVPTYIGYNRITGLTGAGINWRSGGVASIDVRGGAADETYVISGNPEPTAIRIDGGGGTNTLDYTDYDAAYQGLAAVYSGEGDATDGHGENDGVPVGGVTFEPGKVGQAFRFDGTTGHVRVPNAPSLESPAVAVEAWVNSSVTGRNRYLVAKGADQNLAPSYALYTGENGGLVFCTYDGTVYTESPDAGAGIWDGNWHHVVGTFDGSVLRLYVDGVEVGTGTPSFRKIAYNLPTSNDLFLGGYNGNLTASHAYAGLLDEVSIFGRALTEADVRDRFASGGVGLYGTAGVTVNLRTGTATGLRGGINRIRNVVGSAGNDILVGDGGNLLTGGAGRDLLIAGPTASALFGGDGEDLLIGGTSPHDTNPSLLDAVMAEWARTDADYTTRFGNLRGGLLESSPQLRANGQQNQLYGGGADDVLFGVLDVDLSDREGNEEFVRL
ncbi:MAG TPA: LamG-like jellyroll fold domain-containing protein [Gemmataceae bacterium]|nr:LamG-like jellyroll fold domain-containing protein [Gemmataceae bacterium]